MPEYWESAGWEGSDLQRVWMHALAEADPGAPTWEQRTTWTDYNDPPKETPVSAAVELFSRPFWATLLSSLYRQALQAFLVLFVALQGGGIEGTPTGVAVALVVPLVFTVLKAVAAAVVSPGAPKWQGLAARAISAAAGVLAGLTVATLADVLTADWRTILLTSLGAAGAAVVNYLLDPASPAKLPGSDSGNARVSAVWWVGAVLLLALIALALLSLADPAHTADGVSVNGSSWG